METLNLSNTAERSAEYELLVVAIEEGQVEVAKILLAGATTVNSISQRNWSTPLHTAAGEGYLEIVDMLCKKCAKFEAKNIRGETPLHCAVYSKRMQITELLLNQGANIHARTASDETALHIAIEKDCLPIVECLLKHGADANGTMKLRYEEGITPLHIAAHKGNSEIIKLLLRNNAHVNAETTKTRTPLHVAAKSKQDYAVNLLLKHGANVDVVDAAGNSILHHAVVAGSSAMVGNILRYSPDITNVSNRYILNAAICGRAENGEIAESLLQYGFDVTQEDADNSEFLHAAVCKGCLNVVAALLKNGVDVNMELLHSAAISKQEEVARLLINNNADVNSKNRVEKTPIFYAIKNCDLKMIKLFSRNGVNVKDNPGLLHYVVQQNHTDCVEIVEILLQHGMDVNATSHHGYTALHLTISSNYVYCYDNKIQAEIVEVLLSKGASVNVQTHMGETALHLAAKDDRYIDVIEVLLKYNANVSFQDKRGQTPLCIAASSGVSKIIELLLESKADVNFRDALGRTPLWLASREKNAEGVAILLDYGADINITNNYGQAVFDYSDNINDSIVILEQHIIKMIAANIYVSKKNLQSIKKERNTEFQKNCEEQVERLRRQKIGNSTVSYYDILTKHINQLVKYLRNRNISQVLTSDTSDTSFPLYDSMINIQIRKGMKKKELLEVAKKSFLNIFELPDNCIDEILHYLSDEDLGMLTPGYV